VVFQTLPSGTDPRGTGKAQPLGSQPTTAGVSRQCIRLRLLRHISNTTHQRTNQKLDYIQMKNFSLNGTVKRMKSKTETDRKYPQITCLQKDSVWNV
jgi:hypothetical protein